MQCANNCEVSNQKQKPRLKPKIQKTEIIEKKNIKIICECRPIDKNTLSLWIINIYIVILKENNKIIRYAQILLFCKHILPIFFFWNVNLFTKRKQFSVVTNGVRTIDLMTLETRLGTFVSDNESERDD